MPGYPLYLLLGVILFNYFRLVTAEATRILDESRVVIKSIKFPLEALIGCIILKNFYAHLFEIFVFAIFLLYFKLSLFNLLYYPLLLLFFMIFSYGVCLALSSLTVHFKDLSNIWLFVSQLFWFATPIFYSANDYPVLFLINKINPLYYFITIARDLIIYERLPQAWLVGGLVVQSLLFFLIGHMLFQKLTKKIPEFI